MTIKRSAAAQSNYRETSGPGVGLCWELSPFLGMGRDLQEGCPQLSISCLPRPACLGRSLFVLPAASGEQAQGERASSSPPQCLFPRKWLFADACAAALPKTLPEAKEFAGGCALSGQPPPDCPMPGTVTQKAMGT